jgi:hypothetical protein
MSFTKLFASITASTIWNEPDHTRIVWITMLAMADRDGYVAASIPGLAVIARVPTQSVVIAMESFCSPDPWSRTKDHEGRRAQEVDGGWILLNYDKYRAQMSVEDQREKTAARVRKFRERKALHTVTVTHVTPSNDIAEAEAEAEAEASTTPIHLIEKPKKRKAGEFVSPAQAEAFAEFWGLYPKKVAKPNAQKAYIKAILTTKQHKAVMDGLRTQLAGLLARDAEHRPHPASWLNARRWEDIPEGPRMMTDKERGLAG